MPTPSTSSAQPVAPVASAASASASAPAGALPVPLLPADFLAAITTTTLGSPQVLFKIVAETLDHGLSKDQAEAALTVVRLQPNVAMQSPLFASGTPASIAAVIKHLRTVAEETGPDQLEDPAFIAKALAGRARSLSIRSPKSAQKILHALRAAPDVFLPFADNAAVVQWVQHARGRAGETGYDKTLGLGPPPPTVAQAAALSSDQALELITYWRKHLSEAKTYAIINGAHAATAYASLCRSAGIKSDAALDPIFAAAASEAAAAKAGRHPPAPAAPENPSASAGAANWYAAAAVAAAAVGAIVLLRKVTSTPASSV